MKNLSIDALNMHLFESIEMLKNQTDPKASENEKMDVATARAIADISKIAIEGFKVKAQVLGMMRNAENPIRLRESIIESGIITDDKLLLS